VGILHLLWFQPVPRFPEKSKIAFKSSIRRVCLSAFRYAERFLPVSLFYFILRPFFYGRATVNNVFKKTDKTFVMPGFLKISKNRRVRVRQRADVYINHVLDNFPDRLIGAKWLNRCPIDGVGHLHAARQGKQPVILAFCHFGPYYLLRSWLRAAGFPAGIWMSNKTSSRTIFRRSTDRFTLWPDCPQVLCRDQWREVADFLQGGNLLLMAIDVPVGKQIDVPLGHDWHFHMAAGAVRLAHRYDASLIPCSIIDEGAWKFRIQLGPPVPPEYLATAEGWPHAAKHLIDEMLPHFKAHPNQCSNDVTRCIKPYPLAPLPDECILTS
jgi:hypothetical protein